MVPHIKNRFSTDFFETLVGKVWHSTASYKSYFLKTWDLWPSIPLLLEEGIHFNNGGTES